MTVVLFGGPLDGELRQVEDGCTELRYLALAPDWATRSGQGTLGELPRAELVYRRTDRPTAQAECVMELVR